MSDPSMFHRLFDDITKWAKATFPHQTTKSKLTHLAREVVELRAAQDDIYEYADVLILTMSAAAESGLSSYDLLKAVDDKMEINKARTWGKTDAEGVAHHLDE